MRCHYKKRKGAVQLHHRSLPLKSLKCTAYICYNNTSFLSKNKKNKKKKKTLPILLVIIISINISTVPSLSSNIVPQSLSLSSPRLTLCFSHVSGDHGHEWRVYRELSRDLQCRTLGCWVYRQCSSGQVSDNL